MARSELRKEHASDVSGKAPRIQALTTGDVEGGLALSDAAGWNQTADDWMLFVQLGRALGCRDDAGRLVATAATLPYGVEAAWISMVLVDEGWRHRGLASALLRTCIAQLQAAGTTPFLDATPAGAAVYLRLGFAAGFGFERWQSRGAWNGAISGDAPRALGAGDFERIAALDRAAGGLERRALLQSLLSRQGTRAWLAPDGGGFVVARDGRRAMQIGPLVASGGAQAVALLGAALAAARQPVLIDAASGRHEVAAWLQSHGFQRQRSFVRMSLGATQAPALGELSFALAGPEFG